MIVSFLSCNEVPSDYCADFNPIISLDDVPLVQALEARGAEVRAVDWKAVRPVDLAGSTTLVRSCWNYHRSPDAFRTWIEEARACRLALLNAPDLVLRTMDKRYLMDLQAGGIKSVPTKALDPSLRLSGYFEDGVREVIIKPVIGASSEQVFRLPQEATVPGAVLEAIEGGMDFLVQPFLPEIMGQGELSLIFLGGAFSHAVRKVPAAGDFRVQYEYGGRHEPAEVDARLIKQAEEAAGFFGEPLYARVDGVVVDGVFRLMELELIEPELFLVGNVEAAERLADLVMGER